MHVFLAKHLAITILILRDLYHFFVHGLNQQVAFHRQQSHEALAETAVIVQCSSSSFPTFSCCMSSTCIFYSHSKNSPTGKFKKCRIIFIPIWKKIHKHTLSRHASCLCNIHSHGKFEKYLTSKTDNEIHKIVHTWNFERNWIIKTIMDMSPQVEYV